MLLEELSAAGVERGTLSLALKHPQAGAPLATSAFRGLHELRVDGTARLDGAGPIADCAERLGATGPTGPTAPGERSSTSLIRAITREGIPEIVARAYVNELEGGGAFLSARVAGSRAGKVVALMNRHSRRTVATAGAELPDDAQLGESVVRPFM